MSASYSLARHGIRKAKRGDGACVLEPLTEADEYEEPKASLGSVVAWVTVWLLGIVLVLFLAGVIVYVEFFYKWSFPLRVDCNLDDSLDITRCLKRGCKYVVTDDKLPVCFFPADHGYVISGPVESTPDGFKLQIHRHTDAALFGKEFDDVGVEVFYETNNRVRFRLAPINETRYEPSILPHSSRSGPVSDSAYRVSYEEGKPFGIKVERKETGTVLFDSAMPGMVMSEQFLQISTRLATENAFGLGQSSRLRVMDGTGWRNWTLFSKRSPQDSVLRYPGVHPFYVVTESDGKAHGVLLMNSNAMDITVQPERVITFRTIGGIFDFYVFLGSSPADVLQQYMQLVGRPFMPPLWALGSHAEVRAQTPLDDVPGLVKEMRAQGVLVEAVHIESGYVNGRRYSADDGTSDKIRRLKSDLSAMEVKVLLRADPIVHVSDQNGIDDKFLIRRDNGMGLLPTNFTEDVAFVDFSNPKAVDHWSKVCRKLYGDLGYDGLVLNANEPTYPRDFGWTACSRNKWNDPPYSPGGLRDPFERSVCGDSLQFLGRHYDLHNVYGRTHAEATWKSMRDILPQTRPLITSSSTFVGSGRYAGHLHRPTSCSWKALRESIVQVVQLSLFGISYSGSRVPFASCSEELRSRWLQLTAFFPFSVFELTQPKADPAVTENATKEAIETRYRLLPYLYTLFYEANTKGSPVVRPLFYEFPQDVHSHTIDHQFLWGPAILISPAIYEGADYLEAYFPPGVWYDVYTGKKITSEEGSTAQLPTVASNPHLHIRGGHIVPIQLSSAKATSKQNLSLALFVAPDESGSAAGEILLDDGNTYKDDMTRAQALHMSFTLTRSESLHILSTRVESNTHKNPSGIVLDKVVVCGIAKPTRIEMETKVLTTGAFKYDAGAKVLQLHSLHLAIAGNHTIKMTSPMKVY